MRDIKFRAWDKKNKHFVYQPTSYVISFDGSVLSRQNDSEDNAGYIMEGDFLLEPDIELMQYTGLHDKNGKEIYEGDVVLRRNTSDEYKERWGTEKYTIIYDCKEAKYRLKEESDVWGLIWKMEVIGNIYENPELLS